jgi:integrase
MDKGRLTGFEIEGFLPKQKDYKKTDGHGMHLVVSTSGKKWWRYDFQLMGKRKTISFGSFPAIDIHKARQQRVICEDLITRDVDPALHRKRWLKEKTVTESFDSIAKEWRTFHSIVMTDQVKRKATSILNNDVFPILGNMPIKNISASVLSKLLQGIEDKGQIDKAHRTRQIIQNIFKYAFEAGIIIHNPTINLRESQKSLVTRHYKHIEKSEDISRLISGISAYSGDVNTRLALEFAALVFVRPAQLINSKWSDINLDAKEWRISVNGTQHVVPLADQALKILIQAKPPVNQKGFIFHARKSRHSTLSSNTLNHALKTITGNTTQITVWGFRRMAEKNLIEMGWSQTAVKKQLQNDSGYEGLLQQDMPRT